MSTQLPGDAENWDAEDSQSTVEPLLEDTPIDEEQVVIESVTEEEELQQPMAE